MYRQHSLHRKAQPAIQQSLADHKELSGANSGFATIFAEA
jgi:hypothetical protein